MPELLQDMPDLEKHEVVGSNGTTHSHTITESITSANPEQSDESNLETTPAATEQIEAVEVVAEAEKPPKPANGEFDSLSMGFLPTFRCPTGAVDSLDESTLSEDSLEPNTPIIANEETNDSDSHSSAKR